MANKQKVRGFHIYQDEKDRNIYYDWITKNAYVISDKNVGKYYFYQNRLVFAIIAFVLAVNFVLDTTASFILAVAIVVVMEILFRTRFLPSLTQIAKFKPTKTKRSSMIDQIAESNDKKKVMLKIFLYAAFGILLIINAYIEHLSQTLLGLSIVVGVISIVIALMHIIALTRMK